MKGVAGMTITEQLAATTRRMSKWAKTTQRDDLKRCPFCGTAAIEQMRLANSDTDMQFRILCGNPFCRVDCMTPVHAAKRDAEEAWQDRA
jgi:hypothetical protein